MEGKIFITGGTGSLGVEFLRRAEKENWDCQFTVYSRDEVKQGELKSIYPQHKFILGDVRDKDWLKIVMKGHDVVIHAAAYKQVPAAEVNSGQAVSVNILGSQNVIYSAHENNIPIVVGISTDKSCAPVNCYGATKMVMEKLFQEATLWSKTKYCLVRYGNVLGSRGSVVPLFMKQLKGCGQLTFTDPNMTRFWMTLRMAVNLVIDAHDFILEHDVLSGYNGTVLVPHCYSSTMLELAHAVAKYINCDAFSTKTLGIRPGEKINEKLVHSGESMHTIEGDFYFRIYPAFSKVVGNLPVGYEYTSDESPRFTVNELVQMLDESNCVRS